MTGKPAAAITAEVIAAYVSNNSVRTADLPGLILQIGQAIAGLSERHAKGSGSPPALPITPASSVASEYLVCLEDGLRFKSLKRHLRTKYNLSPDQYRQKWGLPPEYPMVAPAYSKARSALARKLGLGVKKRPLRPGPRPRTKLVESGATATG